MRSSWPCCIGEGHAHQSGLSPAPSTAPYDSETQPAYNDILSSFQCSAWALAEQLHKRSGHQICKAWSRRSTLVYNC